MSSLHSRLSSWLIRSRALLVPRISLFCVPRTGGAVAVFRDWPEDCHPEVQVMFVQPPGRENHLREQPITSMQTTVGTLADAIADFVPRCFAFLGQSLGAKAAFAGAPELLKKTRASIRKGTWLSFCLRPRSRFCANGSERLRSECSAFLPGGPSTRPIRCRNLAWTR